MNKKQKSLSNKGFSLVELIVVIAIMAVLVGLIAPQFVKYVQQAKTSSNTQNVETLQGTANGVLADVELAGVKAGELTITYNSAAVAPATKFAVADTDVKEDDTYNFTTKLGEALGTDGDGNIKYPVPADGKTKFTITISGTKEKGFHATVKLD